MSAVGRRLGWATIWLTVLLGAAFASMIRVIGPAAPSVQPPPAIQPPSSAPPAAPAQSGTDGEDPVPLIIPVAGVHASQLSDTWGQSRGSGTREHHAIDIMAARGTPVLAAASGTVEKLFESQNGGHTIYIRTRDGATIHYYAHLDAYAPGLTEKQLVRQGQQIATVGSTGDASPDAPHLHFEIKAMQPGEGWWQGTEVNPYPLLAGKADGE